MSDFEGVVPAIPTPMGTDGGFHEEAFRKVVEFNIGSGVHGFWVAGGTGESVLLEDEENKAVASAVVDQTAGRAKVIMHVGAPTTDRAAKLAEHAAKVGADALCCVPPFFYRRTDEEIAEHYRIVGAAADLPLFVYNLPGATGVEITPGMMQMIKDRVPQLKGLKHSALSFSNIRTFANMGLSCFVGNHRLMLPAMTIGACGCVDGPLSVWPEIWVALWHAYKAGEWEKAMDLQDKGASAYENLGAKGGAFQALVKAALSERLGVNCGDLRPPGLPLSDAQRKYIKALMTEA
jgi:dihydrodipicolinate synthase/N-acetylneuraminate lyase